MNIIYISSEYPPETGYGGIGTYTKYIAEGMAQQGHTVSVIAQSIDSRESVIHQNGVTVYRLPPLPYPLPRHRCAYMLRKFAVSSFPHVLVRISWALAVKKKINHVCSRRTRFDIIEAAECGAESLFVPRHCAKRHIIRLHTPWEIISKLDTIKEPFGDRLLLPCIEKFAARRASSVSSPSSAMAAHISSAWHINKIKVIPNPLPIDNFLQSLGPGWIYTGRVERRKGVHHLVAAYIKLSKEIPDLPSLTLLGRAYGTDRSGNSYGMLIHKMINTAGFGHAISWIENATLNEVPSYLYRSSVAFFPSLWENYPYTCLEAMASGCAIVASNCGGFPEMIESGINGLLIPPDSEESIYTAMKYLINNDEKVTALGTGARKRVTEIASSTTIYNETEQYYFSLLEKRR
jgi:glycosyltransferase involved in cell wall biosynthesis